MVFMFFFRLRYLFKYVEMILDDGSLWVGSNSLTNECGKWFSRDFFLVGLHGISMAF